MCELILAAQSEFDRDAKAFDSHYGDGTNYGTDGNIDDRIGAAIARDDSVNHDEGENKDTEAVHQETCVEDNGESKGHIRISGEIGKAYRVGEHNEGSRQQFRRVCLLVHVGQ